MKWSLILSLVLPLGAFAFEKLPEKYLISYGNPHAKHKVVEYFSFSCPTCVGLFLSEFQEIKSECIETNEVNWVFHPVPLDLTTVQAMVCLQSLSEADKRVFFEEFMDELAKPGPPMALALMQGFLKFQGRESLRIDDVDQLSQSPTFQDAYQFVAQGLSFPGSPCIEVDGVLCPELAPNIENIQKQIKNS